MLDSCVGFKTLVAEQDSDKAQRLADDYRNGVVELLAPEVFAIEIAHAITRGERQGALKYSAIVFGSKGVAPAGVYGYAAPVKGVVPPGRYMAYEATAAEIAKFFKTRKAARQCRGNDRAVRLHGSRRGKQAAKRRTREAGDGAQQGTEVEERLKVTAAIRCV